MRPDPRTPVLVSNLMPGDYSLPGEKRFVVCGHCHTWRRVREGHLWPHNQRNGAPCPQSRRRVWFDLTPRQHHQARAVLLAADAQTAARKAPGRLGTPAPTPWPHDHTGRPRLRPGWDQTEPARRAG